MPAARALFVVLLLAASWPLSAQHGAKQLSISTLAPMPQGGIQRLRIAGAGAGTTVTAIAFERVVPLGAAGDGTWEGLLGADVVQKAGSYPVTVTATRPDGGRESAQATVNVTARKFGTRALRVNEGFVEPPPEDARRIVSDAERLNVIFGSVSERRWQRAFRAPVAGEATSNFGTRSFFNGQPRAPHAGIDYRGAVGTPIVAPNAGRVVLADDLFFTGNTVVVDHGLGLFTLLAHMSRMDVKVGDDVTTGSPVGLVGKTGRVTGPHLHWSVRLGAARVDPALVLQLAP
jgi:murein DD-endopeptidase MepM/ murein hydrolase activator NlpD